MATSAHRVKNTAPKPEDPKVKRAKALVEKVRRRLEKTVHTPEYQVGVLVKLMEKKKDPVTRKVIVELIDDIVTDHQLYFMFTLDSHFNTLVKQCPSCGHELVYLRDKFVEKLLERDY